MAVSKVIMQDARGVQNVLVDLTGDTVTPEVLAAGYTAHGADGEPVTGTMTAGTSDNNVEAYHITDASTPITFKRTDGDIKVFGYGYGSSGYSSYTYAFNGSGYYRGSLFGSPSHTNVTWSLDSSGLLQGLPTVSQLDIIVTKGI